MKPQPEIFQLHIRLSSLILGNNDFFYTVVASLRLRETFRRLSFMGSGVSDITVLSPAFSPGCSGISFRSMLMISPCPIDSRSENPCCFLGTIADVFNGFDWFSWWSLVALFLCLQQKMIKMAPILGHMSLELGFGEDVVALWRVFLAGEGVNTCLVHATRVNEVVLSGF
ncbi:hypothetical protein HID58_075862 [Brassica napus]|uniref:Uncharacterized protein n=1 Tax=Brassica napus TaxID=3708 RepID=A0ABQ7YKU8_BRANA|nr:hypothetical protein HID58_075862 [Brassica napus]